MATTSEHLGGLRLPVNPATLARLHGQACVVCGATNALTPAGHAYTLDDKSGHLGWRVVACPQHQGKR